MFFIFQLDPSKGNVAFGSGLYGWGFSLPQFASFYSSKMGLDENKMLKRLWGNHFYNAEVRKWSKTPQPGYVRGFVKFVLQPIYKVKKKEKHYNAHMSYLQDFHKENLKGMFIGYNGAHYNTLIQWFTAAY